MAFTAVAPPVTRGPRCGPRGVGPCPRHRWEGSTQLRKYETRTCLVCGGRFERPRVGYRVIVPPEGAAIRIGSFLPALPACPGTR